MVRGTQRLDMIAYCESIITDSIDNKVFIKRFQNNYELMQERQVDQINNNVALPLCFIELIENGNNASEHELAGLVLEKAARGTGLLSYDISVPSTFDPTINVNYQIIIEGISVDREYNVEFRIQTETILEAEMLKDAIYYTYDTGNWVVPLTRFYDSPIEVGTILSELGELHGISILDYIVDRLEPDSLETINIGTILSVIDNNENLVVNHKVEPLIRLNNSQIINSAQDTTHGINLDFSIRFRHISDINCFVNGYIKSIEYPLV